MCLNREDCYCAEAQADAADDLRTILEERGEDTSGMSFLDLLDRFDQMYGDGEV